eukprot:12339190-Karenia_brevis.AAC.1
MGSEWRQAMSKSRLKGQRQGKYWPCAGCGYTWNFVNRGTCYKCEKARPQQAPKPKTHGAQPLTHPVG